MARHASQRRRHRQMYALERIEQFQEVQALEVMNDVERLFEAGISGLAHQPEKDALGKTRKALVPQHEERQHALAGLPGEMGNPVAFRFYLPGELPPDSQTRRGEISPQ